MSFQSRIRPFVESERAQARQMRATTKTVFGLVPVGNTGGSNVSPFKPMVIPEDLRHILDAAEHRS